MRIEQDVFKPRSCRVGLDAPQSLVIPGPNFAKHDVVHGDVRLSVDGPVFVEGGGAVFNPPTPGREIFLCGDLVGQIGVAMVAEGVEDGFGTKQAYVQV